MGPETAPSAPRWRWPSEVFVLEAASRPDLRERALALRAWLKGATERELTGLAWTLNGGLTGLPSRLAIVATSVADLDRKIEHALGRLADPAVRRVKDRSGIFHFDEPLGKDGGVALLFPGEGAQYPHMLADLCLHFPAVRACFERTDRAFDGHPRGYLPSEFIFPLPSHSADPGTQEARLWQMDGAVEAVFTANIALFALLRELGVRADAVCGHSTGEYSALIASGAFDDSADEHVIGLMQRLNVLYRRLEDRKGIPEATLIAVGAADRATVDAAMAAAGGLHLAIDNCPHQVVLCGAADAAARAVEYLRPRGALCETLPFARAYHTPMFEPVTEPLRAFFAGLPLRAPTAPIWSCATAAPMPPDPDAVRDLATRQWAMPVRFRDTIERMHDSGMRVFLECGPRGNLTAFVEDTLRGRPHLALPMNLHRRSGLTQLNTVVALLAAHGVPFRAEALYMRRVARRRSLEELFKAGHLSDPPSVMVLPSALPSLRLPAGHVPVRPVAVAAAPVAAQAAATTSGAPFVPPSPFSPPVTAPPGERDAVMAAWFQTSGSFVETQRRLMLAFLGGSAAAPAPGIASAATPSAVAPSAPSRPVEAQAVQAVPRAAASAAAPATASAPPATAASAAPLAPPMATTPPAPPTATGGAGRTPAALLETLLGIVSERTGYPPDMLDPALSLEADLGIDSIKRVEILGALQNALGAFPPDAMEGMSRLKTLNEIVDYLGRSLVAGAAAGPGAAAGTGAAAGAGVARATGIAVGATLPLIGTVRSHAAGETLVTRRAITLDEDLYLKAHTLGGGVSEIDRDLVALPLVMLTMGMEFLAQAAAQLVPGRIVVGMRDVRAQRWIALRGEHATIEISARVTSAKPLEVTAEMREIDPEATEGGALSPAVQGIVELADAYPEPPRASAFALTGDRPSRFRPGDLYTRVMFHGPLLRGTTHFDRWGEDGAEATLVALPDDRLFRSTTAPAFHVDPVLLDQAGQVVGFWTADHLETGFVVFPYRVDRLRLFGPPARVPATFKGRARIALIGEQQIRSDLEVVAPDGRVHMLAEGWEDKRMGVTPDFFRFRFAPRDVVLSEVWHPPLPEAARRRTTLCCRMPIPHEILEADSAVWQEGLAHLILGRRERLQWRALKAIEKRRTEWLIGRLVIKDAVRGLLRERLGLVVAPADIEVTADDHGRPRVSGAWEAQLGAPLSVSLSHAGGVAAALVSLGPGHGVGLDIEHAQRRNSGFLEQAALTDDERAILATLPGAAAGADDPRAAGSGPAPGNQEWLMRFWCAKEAAAKATGRGLNGNPKRYVVRSVEPRTGDMMITTTAADGAIPACTAKDGAFIVATAIHQSP